MSLYYLLQKKALHDYEPVTVTAYSYLYGAIVMALVSIWKMAENDFDAFILSTRAWESLAFAVVVRLR